MSKQVLEIIDNKGIKNAKWIRTEKWMVNANPEGKVCPYPAKSWVPSYSKSVAYFHGHLLSETTAIFEDEEFDVAIFEALSPSIGYDKDEKSCVIEEGEPVLVKSSSELSQLIHSIKNLPFIIEVVLEPIEITVSVKIEFSYNIHSVRLISFNNIGQNQESK